MGQNNNGIISPAFPPVLTFVSLVCCVGHCGEGTDWVSDDRKSGTKVGSSAKVPPSCQRWCRPQSKLPKPTASQKARHFAGENSNQNVHVGYFQSRFQSAERLLFLFQTVWVLYHSNNYGEPKSDKKTILLWLIFVQLPFWLVTGKFVWSFGGGGVLQSIKEAAIPSISYGWHCTQGWRIPLLHRSLQMHLQLTLSYIFPALDNDINGTSLE